MNVLCLLKAARDASGPFTKADRHAANTATARALCKPFDDEDVVNFGAIAARLSSTVMPCDCKLVESGSTSCLRLEDTLCSKSMQVLEAFYVTPLFADLYY